MEWHDKTAGEKTLAALIPSQNYLRLSLVKG